MRAIIYDRGSDRKQADNYSRVNAREEGIRIAERHGFTWEYVKEIGSGATLARRPILLSTLDRIAKGEIQAVIVQDLDRLARPEERAVYETIRDICLDNGVEVYTQSGKFNFADDTDDFVADINMAVAKKERNTFTKRVTRSMKEKARVGGYNGGPPPLGFRLKYDEPKVTGEKPKADLAIDESERRVIELIFELYLTYGAHGTATRLNEMGYTGKKGSPFRSITISQVIKNPLYAGFVVWGRRRKSRFLHGYEPQWVHRPDLQIVSPALWEQAQDVFKQRSRQTKKAGEWSHHAFTGIVACEKCKGSLVGSNPGRGEAILYSCATRRKYGKDGCEGCNYVEHKLADAVIPFVCHLINYGLDQTLNSAAEKYGKTISEAELEQRVEAELIRVKEAKNRIVKAIAADVISEAEAESEMSELRGKEERLKRELAVISEKAAIRSDYLRVVEKLKQADIDQRLRKIMTDSPRTFRRALALIFEPNSLVLAKDPAPGRTRFTYRIIDFKITEVVREHLPDDYTTLYLNGCPLM